MSFKITQCISLSLLFVFVSGISSCEKNKNTILSALGNYDGFVLKKINRSTDQVFVSGQLSLDTKNNLNLILKSKIGNEIWNIEISLQSSNEIILKASEIFTGTALLKGDLDRCYYSGPELSVGQLKVCLDQNEISLGLVTSPENEFMLIADRRGEGDVPQFETPQSYTISQLVEKAKNQSFSTLIQFQKAVQSRMNAQLHYRNLVTHFSWGNVLGLWLNHDWTFVVRMVGDLAPFLLPTNWFNANAAQFQFEADYDAWLLMKADAGNIVEGLGYNLLRDQRILEEVQKLKPMIVELQEAIQGKERLGLVPVGSSNTITTVVDLFKTVEINLESAVILEKTSLSQSSGFYNPEAISKIELVLDYSVRSPILIDQQSMQNLAIERSVELRQLDFLIHSAQESLKGRYFAWLDPSGGGSPGFGLGYSTYIDIAQVKIEELLLQRQQLQSILLKKISDAIDMSQSSLSLYEVATTDLTVQQDRVNQLRDSMRMGFNVSTLELQNALQGQMKAVSDQINAEYAYIVAVSNINRLLFMGPYLDIYSKIAANPKSNSNGIR